MRRPPRRRVPRGAAILSVSLLIALPPAHGAEEAPAADESPTALEASPRSGADERRAENVPTASEALRVLTGLAHRRTGRIPAPLLVRHALRVARGGGWPVEKAVEEAHKKVAEVYARHHQA